VVKGGFVLELRLQRARTTQDVDLWMIGNPERMLLGLQDAGRLDLGDYLLYEVRPDARHPRIEAEGLHYEGLRFRAAAQLAGKLYGSPFGVDVAFAEPLSEKPEAAKGSTLLEFVGVEPANLLIYPLGIHLAEKLHAYTLPRPKPNSRVKDLPDITLLGTVRPLDAEKLRGAIEWTFGHRGTHPVPTTLPAAPESWRPVYERMAAIDRLAWPTLAAVFEAASAFLDPVLSGARGRWDPDGWRWVE